jgi:polar amino acid transport system substrate-binding protein
MKKTFKLAFATMAAVFLMSPLVCAETVKIIAEDAWYPYSGQTENGVAGIAVDIVRETFKAEGIDVDFEAMGYDQGMLLVKDGGAIGCFDAPRTKEIEETYLWHDEPMFTAKSFFYATSDYKGSLKGVEDIGGRKLGLTQGYGYGNAIDMNDSLNKEYSKTDEVILRKLTAGRLDFIVLYDKVAEHLISKLGVQGKVKEVGLSEATDLYVVFSKKNPDGQKYRDIFSRGFRKIKTNGSYQQILDSWEAKFKNKPQPTEPNNNASAI